jgi:hypothetical protein
MTSVSVRPDDGMQTSLLVALETQGSGFEVAPKGLCGASGPAAHGGSLAIWPVSMVNPAW